MTAIEILTAIGCTKSLSTLDGFARAIWADWGAGRLTDEQASALAETLEGRKREVRGDRHRSEPGAACGGAGQRGRAA